MKRKAQLPEASEELTDRVLAWDAAQRAEPERADDGTTLFVASTDEEDRFGSIVRQDWNLRAYKTNPVVLDNHDPLRVVGRGIDPKVPRTGDDAGRLMIRVAWDDQNPDPSIVAVGHQHRNGFRSAGSVRWNYGKVTQRNKLAADHPAFKQAEKKQVAYGDYVFEYETAGLYYERNELWEFSSATIPGNAGALQRSYLELMAELDPEDIGRRLALAGETVPARVAGDLVEMARSAAPEQRAGLVDLLWPEFEERMRVAMRSALRTDTEMRRIVQAYEAAGPAKTNPDLLSRVADLIRE